MSSEFLGEENLVRRRFLIKVYRCPNCGTSNQFFEDRRFPHLEESAVVRNRLA